VTVPKAVRHALGIKAGDEVVFRVEASAPCLLGRLTSSTWLAR
jgi:bifunctional DNA-binding transcriptional regulator/antitoxin component of YhaV-PrlF toxin-antitoxin module